MVKLTGKGRVSLLYKILTLLSQNHTLNISFNKFLRKNKLTNSCVAIIEDYLIILAF